jgi:hypothetical protein
MRITNPYTGDVSQSSGGGGYSLWGGRKCLKIVIRLVFSA